MRIFYSFGFSVVNTPTFFMVALNNFFYIKLSNGQITVTNFFVNMVRNYFTQAQSILPRKITYL
jgi:hypothetical protein